MSRAHQQMICFYAMLEVTLYKVFSRRLLRIEHYSGASWLYVLTAVSGCLLVVNLPSRHLPVHTKDHKSQFIQPRATYEYVMLQPSILHSPSQFSNVAQYTYLVDTLPGRDHGRLMDPYSIHW
jgi:hypothetical protein